MDIDWGQVSTSLSVEQAESAFEPVGRFVLIHTQFDLQLGRLVAAISGLGGNRMAHHLMHAVDAVSKKRILDGVASIYTVDPSGLVPNYVPQPELRKRLKRVAAGFEASSKVRNTLAHGTMGRLGDRVFIGSVSAAVYFRNTGGADGWVFMDELEEALANMLGAMEEAKALEKDFINAQSLDFVDNSG